MVRLRGLPTCRCEGDIVQVTVRLDPEGSSLGLASLKWQAGMLEAFTPKTDAPLISCCVPLQIFRDYSLVHLELLKAYPATQPILAWTLLPSLWYGTFRAKLEGETPALVPLDTRDLRLERRLSMAAYALHTILVGYDGSVSADKAVELAGTLAQKTGAATVVVCYAFGHTPPTAKPSDVQELIAPALARLSEMGVATEVATPDAPPAEGILATAQEYGADLVVVGSRGRGTFAGLLLGSVSERVIRHASIPVLVAR